MKILIGTNNKKIIILIIFLVLVVVIFGGVFINKYYLKDKILDVNLEENESVFLVASDKQSENIKILQEAVSALKALGTVEPVVKVVDVVESTVNPAVKVVSNVKASNFKNPALNLSDPEGQIVHHLFNIEGAPSAKGAAFTLDGREIWTTLLLNKRRGVSVFSALDGTKIADINLNGGGGVEIIFSEDGTKAYVSQMETGKVFEIDVFSKKILRVFNTGGIWTKFLVLSYDGKTLFASNWSSNNVSQIDLSTGKLIKKIRTVTTPRGLYVTKDGNYLYVAGFDKGEIQKINLNTGQSKIILKTGGAMRQIVGDEDRGLLFVSDMGRRSVWQINMKNDVAKKFVATDVNPNTIELSPDKKILFVSCRGVNFSSTNYYKPGPEWGSVLMFDAITGEMLDAIVGGNQPTALAISSDSTRLVFSNFLDATLEVFEIPSYEVLKAGNGGRSSIYKSELRK